MFSKNTSRKPKIDPDVKLIAGILDAQMQALGRGSLTWLAGKLGMTVSAARKRTRAKGFGLDAASIRAVLLILATKADRFTTKPTSIVTTENYRIELQETKEGIIPTWKQK